MQHADVSPQQRVLHPAHQESVPADLKPGCRLTSHTPPVPSLRRSGAWPFTDFGWLPSRPRDCIPAGVFSRFPCRIAASTPLVLRVVAGACRGAVLAEG